MWTSSSRLQPGERGETDVTNGVPKSAYELAMEKLKAQDEAIGTSAGELTAEQMTAISAARRDYEANVAECRILHESAMATTFDPAAREELEANYRRDLARFETNRDKKIKRIRSGE